MDMDKKNRITIAYIGGGSINFGWKFFSELAAEELCATVNLYDTDKKLALSNETIGNNMRENPDCKCDIVFLACETPEEALRHASIVIMSVSSGTIDETVTELTLPEKYGIYQSSAEQSGPAGIIRALKILPECIKYARLIKRCCPDAWVVNLTNPMAECIGIMKDTFPEIKIFGSTNELFQTLEFLGGLVELEYGISHVRRRDIKYNLIGISGFSWFDRVSYNGEDLMPLFRQYAQKYYNEGFELHQNEYRTNPLSSANKIKFDLFLRYGLIPAVPDRIVADFCPVWYLKSPQVVQNWKFSRTSANYIKKLNIDRSGRIKPLMNGTEQLGVGGNYDDCALQIRALAGGGNLITNACTVNSGQVENLPDGAVVSTNALISKNNVQPVASGRLPDEIYALTIRHVINRFTILKAVSSKDLDIAFNAFLNDPLVNTDLNSATELYKEMLSAVRKKLVYYAEN
jgi:alpha-galactosidase